MKMTLKRENDEFLVITLKHVSGLRIVVNPPRAPKQCAIAHENGHKAQERRIVGHPLKHASGLTVHANPRGAPKQRGIAHENDRKTRKR